jgi:hypothetical protein
LDPDSSFPGRSPRPRAIIAAAFDGVNDDGKVMYGLVAAGQFRRALTPVDVDGVKWIYGDGAVHTYYRDVDGDGKPIEGARVILVSSEDGAKYELTSDNKGRWRKAPGARCGCCLF